MRSASILAIVDPMPSALLRIIIQYATASPAIQAMRSSAAYLLAVSRTMSVWATSSAFIVSVSIHVSFPILVL